MKEITNLLKLTQNQLLFATLKYLGYEIYACGEHDEDNPYRWPGNAKVTELARDKPIITVSLTGEIHLETSSGSSPIMIFNLIGNHLHQMVSSGGVLHITSGKHEDFQVTSMLQLDNDEEVECKVHGRNLNETICFAFVQARCKLPLLVPDALVISSDLETNP